jgi:hypothetical protein
MIEYSESWSSSKTRYVFSFMPTTSTRKDVTTVELNAYASRTDQNNSSLHRNSLPGFLFSFSVEQIGHTIG